MRVEATFEYEDIPSIYVTDTEPELTDIAQEQRECSDFKDIINYLENGILPKDSEKANVISAEANNQYVMSNGILYHLYTARSRNQKDQTIDFDKVHIQLAVPRVKRKSILLAFHDCLAGGGHFGLKKTHHAIRDKYFWPKMFHDIEMYIKTCDICQRSLGTNHLPH